MTSEFNQPLGGNEMPRFGGIATMMRLPHVADNKGLDVAFVGVPFDIDTSGNTALTAANLLFEMLCVLPGVAYHS